MNAGLNGLPGGAQARRVVGMVRRTGQSIGAANMVTAAMAENVGTFPAVADINLLQLITSISGRGALLWGCVSGVGSGNQRVVVEVDGSVIFDKTHGVTSSSNGTLFVGGGSYDSTTAIASVAFQCIPFLSSVRVFVANSVTGSGNPNCYINAEVYA